MNDHTMLRSENIWTTATDPKAYTDEQLRCALALAVNFFGDYWRGMFRGGEVSWDDLDATHEAAAEGLPELRAMALEIAGLDHFDRSYHDAEAGVDDATPADYAEWFNAVMEEYRE